MARGLPRRRVMLSQPLVRLDNQHRTIMRGVIYHFFWLRADMARLRRFIDSYLNFVHDSEPPPFYFRPAAPFVAFQLIYYPYISLASLNSASYPYREMSFTIPLECYANEDGALVFKQFAVCTPFIFVDDELAIVAGRDLFGLPKVGLRFENPESHGRPDLPTPLARLLLRSPSARGDVFTPFIEVTRRPARYSSANRFRQDLLYEMPDLLGEYSALATDAWKSLVRPPLAGFDRHVDMQSAFGMLRAYGEVLSACFPTLRFLQPARPYSESSADRQFDALYMDLISLKQVRDAEHRNLVSYQSLVRSTLYFDSINDVGVLFGPPGDPGSDVNIKIRHLPSQPVVDSLGLITEDEYVEESAVESIYSAEQSGSTEVSKTTVSMLKPVFPFWLNVDLVYALGTTLYWRGKNTTWSSSFTPATPSDGNRYLTFDGGALEEEAYPLAAPRTFLWIFELPLDVTKHGRERLERLCSGWLDNDCYAIRLADGPASVWMLAGHFDETAEGEGVTGRQTVQFFALVQWFEKRDARAWGPPIGTALMPLFVLSDNQRTVFTENEVLGWPTVLADIAFLPSKWNVSNAAYALRARTLLLSELDAGAAPANEEILRITAKMPVAASPTTLRRETAKPIILSIVSFKQILNPRLPEYTDYQAVTIRALSIDPQLPQPRDTGYLPFLDNKLWGVNFSRYESLSLVEQMGLRVSRKSAGARTTIDVVLPERVWAIRASVEELGVINLAWRLGDSRWISHDRPLQRLEQIASGLTASIQSPGQFAKLLDGASLGLR